MASAVKRGLQKIFERAEKSQSALKRILNPSADGAGTRVFPPQNPNSDRQIGLRIDKGEPVQGKANVLKLKLQVNKNADDPTLKKMADQNSHAVVSEAEVNVAQEPNVENLKSLFSNFEKNIRL
ncbi:hypothetical protein Aspvir_006166 [Aspergillus viridinutans]|uniref:Uncharacterized protein n=1 Tax=Aspergillus viridinutans TaxID=75553 RepID=A0A9P3BTC4_ASPVI|nr:uncharacterized protein Aspvir_006166 [Aspergillus viridinutans]GIK02123.1 hypothetical protein Aspvir_006166 [Aspergillus viridinutans]